MHKALLTLLATVTLDAIGMGLVMPILPSLLRQFGGSDRVAMNYGVILAAYAFMQFLFSPALGALSDRFGRRPVLLLSLAGSAVDYLIMAFAPSLWVLVLGRLIGGITSANMSVATAYIADVTAPADRAKRYGQLSACFGLGFIAGPALGGLFGHWSLHYPFLLAAALNALNFLVACFLLPESHQGERRAITSSSLNPLLALRGISGSPMLPSLIAAYLLIMLIGQVAPTLWVLYGQDKFGWDDWTVGLSLSAFGVAHAISQAFLTEPLTRRLGEIPCVIFGMIADATGYVLLAVATHGWMPFALISLLALGGTGQPALQSLLSRQVGEDQQGSLQGTLVSLGSVIGIIGPLLVSAVYAATAGFWYGTTWMLAAILYPICLPALRRASRLTASMPAPS